MLNYIERYFDALFVLLGDLWLWFLIGFLAAGVVAEFIPRRFIIRHFGKNNISSLLKAALSGLVASTCSCGAIPMSVTLRERGASTAVALTFLLATPWSGAPQFLVLSNFLGVANTLFLMFYAVVAAFITGLLLSRLENRQMIDSTQEGPAASCSTCADDSNNDYADRSSSETRKSGWRSHFVGVLRHAWNNFRDIGKFIILGLVLAAALSAFVPINTVQRYFGASDSPWGILMAVPVSAVIECCSEGFSVFAGQLYIMGATLGVVFVMLMVGVTTDITEITVVWGKFGKRSAIAYVLTSTTVVIVMAYILRWVSRYSGAFQ